MLTEIKYSAKTQRYRVFSGAGKGQFISKVAFIEQVKQGILTKTNELLELEFNDQFEFRAAEILRSLHVGQAILGKDGWENMNPRDWQQVSSTLKEQLGLSDSFGLRYLVDDLLSGKATEKQFRARLGMYAKASKLSFYKALSEANNDKPFARRTLGKTDQHCPECLQYASMGVVPKNILPLPGMRCTCRSNCLCTISFLSETS